MHQLTATLNPRRTFARHFGEMLLAMFLGMAVLGGLGAVALDDPSAAAHVVLMGLYMTVPMVAWMSYRGHTAGRNAEMAASMIVPSLLAALLASAGVLGEGGALGLQHAVMIPAMLGVMLWRYDEYSRPH